MRSMFRLTTKKAKTHIVDSSTAPLPRCVREDVWRARHHHEPHAEVIIMVIMVLLPTPPSMTNSLDCKLAPRSSRMRGHWDRRKQQWRVSTTSHQVSPSSNEVIPGSVLAGCFQIYELQCLSHDQIELLCNTLRLSKGLGNGSRLDHGAFNLQIGKSRIA